MNSNFIIYKIQEWGRKNTYYKREDKGSPANSIQLFIIKSYSVHFIAVIIYQKIIQSI